MNRRRPREKTVPPAVEAELLEAMRGMIAQAVSETAPCRCGKDISRALLAAHPDAPGIMHLELTAEPEGMALEVMHSGVNHKGQLLRGWNPAGADPRDAIHNALGQGAIAPLLAKVADLAPLPLMSADNRGSPHYDLTRSSGYWCSADAADPMQGLGCHGVTLHFTGNYQGMLDSLDHCIALARREARLREEFGTLPDSAFWPGTRGR